MLKHWAGAKIARSKSSTTDPEDAELCKVIVDKFEKLGKGAVSYADIARRAWEVGRAGLATKVGALHLPIAVVVLSTHFPQSFSTTRRVLRIRYRSC